MGWTHQLCHTLTHNLLACAYGEGSNTPPTGLDKCVPDRILGMKPPKHRGKASVNMRAKGRFRVDFGIASKHRRIDVSDLRIKSGPGSYVLERKLALARRIALTGLDDDAIAKIGGMSRETLDYLRVTHPELDAAIEDGRTSLDADVVQSLYQLCVGYEREVEEVAGKDAVKVRYKRWHPPELGAIKTWLNARSRKFREVQRIDTTTKGKAIAPKESRADLINSIVGMVRPKPDNAPAKPAAKKGK